MDFDSYKKLRKPVPPPDYEFEKKDKRRYSKSDRYSAKDEIDEGIEEYYKEEE